MLGPKLFTTSKWVKAGQLSISFKQIAKFITIRIILSNKYIKKCPVSRRIKKHETETASFRVRDYQHNVETKTTKNWSQDLHHWFTAMKENL